MSRNYWQECVKNNLKAELVRRGISYRQLADLLAKEGIEDSVQNIRNKINRGSFSAVFLMQVMHVIGCECLVCKFAFPPDEIPAPVPDIGLIAAADVRAACPPGCQTPAA